MDRGKRGASAPHGALHGGGGGGCQPANQQFEQQQTKIRGVARGPWLPQSSIEWIFYGKNWLCWDAGYAVFSKVILFSLSSVFC